MIKQIELAHLNPIIFDSKSKSLYRSPLNILLRFLRMVKIIGVYTYFLIRGKISLLYISLSGGWGQIYELIIIAISKIFKIKIYIHHHSFAYLNRKKQLTKYILNISQKNAIHIVLCERMERLLKNYNSNIKTHIISNTAFLPNQEFCKELLSKKQLTIGFLSNISFDKGIRDYIEVMKFLSTKLHIIGIIAGPYTDKISKTYLEDNLKLLNNIDYIGRINNEQKKNFFEQTDILLFPTNYSNEAEPLVIHEAMSFGVPVIARSGGCIKQIIDTKCGIVFNENEDFIKNSFNVITKLMESNDTLNKLKLQSYDTFNERKINNLISLDNLIEEMASQVRIKIQPNLE